MSFHLLRPLGRSYKCNSPYVVKAGRCFDPFASMINHSCDPNALWHFEGRKLRLVASQILSPGEEICVSYIKYTNYNVRQQELKKGWGFICNCDVCLVGKYGINSEPVFNRVIHPLPMALQELSFTRAALDSEDIDAVEMEIAIFHLMIHLTNRRIHHALRGNRKEALRSCVRQYTLAHEMKPKIDESEFLDILYHMVHLIYGQDFEIGCGAISFISLHLLHEKMLHAKAAFGADSSLYRFETTEYHKLMMTWEKRTGKKWIDLCEKKSLKAKFDKNLDLLQRWAGDLSGGVPERKIEKRK